MSESLNEQYLISSLRAKRRMNCRRVVPHLGFLFGDVAESGRERSKEPVGRSPLAQAIARIVRATKSRFRFGKIFRAGNDLVHNAIKGNELLRRALTGLPVLAHLG